MIDTIVTWLGGESNTVAFAILGSVIGFLAKGVYDLWLARRNDQLNRVNQKLKLLYDGWSGKIRVNGVLDK